MVEPDSLVPRSTAHLQDGHSSRTLGMSTALGPLRYGAVGHPVSLGKTGEEGSRDSPAERWSHITSNRLWRWEVLGNQTSCFVCLFLAHIMQPFSRHVVSNCQVPGLGALGVFGTLVKRPPSLPGSASASAAPHLAALPGLSR